MIVYHYQFRILSIINILLLNVIQHKQLVTWYFIFYYLHAG